MSRDEPPDYLREIERVFVPLRGGTLFLTPADWEVARGWEERGIPLAAALSGIRAALSGGGPFSPRTPLRHCAPAVEAAFAALRRRAAGAAPPTPPAAATTLPAPATTLPAAGATPPAAGAGRDSWRGLDLLAEALVRWTPDRAAISNPEAAGAARAAARAAAAGVRELDAASAPELEDRLAALERELLDRLRAALAPAIREKVAAEARRALAAHRGRMPEAVWRESLAQAVRRRVAAALGVPAFSPAGPARFGARPVRRRAAPGAGSPWTKQDGS